MWTVAQTNVRGPGASIPWATEGPRTLTPVLTPGRRASNELNPPPTLHELPRLENSSSSFPGLCAEEFGDTTAMRQLHARAHLHTWQAGKLCKQTHTLYRDLGYDRSSSLNSHPFNPQDPHRRHAKCEGNSSVIRAFLCVARHRE
jgi:hypothetical protein